MNDRSRDPSGTAAALLAGVLVGLVLAGPMLPRQLPVGRPEVSVGPVGGYLLLGVLALVLLPLGMVLLHVLFIAADR